MTVGRSDFDPAEWQLICQAPTYAGLIVATAERGGPFWEALSIARTYSEVRAHHGESTLLDDLCAERPLVEHTRFRSAEHGLQHVGAAVALLRQKAEPDEVEPFARFLVEVAERVADAYPETVERVSAAEQAAVAEIRAAAGLAHAPS